MEPLHRLADALAHMRFAVEPERFALVGFRGAPLDLDLAALARQPVCQAVREGGETTLLVPEAELGAILARHPGAEAERGLTWIRFESAMAWDLVGFLALVSGRLAAAEVPIGAVCGFHRDHLFVAERHLGRARQVLGELFPEALPGAGTEGVR